MESRVQDATRRHRSGYNCAQAVACTYCDLAGIDERDCFRMTEGMGFGMGCQVGTCGALSGACAVVGMMVSDGNIESPKTKAKSYKVSRAVVERFSDEVGHTTCGIIKGDCGRAPVLKTCPECVELAARVVEEVLLEGQID